MKGIFVKNKNFLLKRTEVGGEVIRGLAKICMIQKISMNGTMALPRKKEFARVFTPEFALYVNFTFFETDTSRGVQIRNNIIF